MKKTLALLAASTALTAAIALPALSETRHRDHEEGVLSSLFGDDGGRLRLWFVSDDDDDHEYSRKYRGDDDDEDDDDDDDYGRRGGGMNPAPAGTVAPPQNGLFGTGAAPKVKVN